MITFSQLGRYGRFGNQLFQIAGTIGLAIKHGYAYAFPRWINYDHKDRFGSTEDVDVQKHFVHKLPTTDIPMPDFPVQWGYHPHLHVPDGHSLSGHFQSEKYFANCKIVIEKAFTMWREPPQNDSVAIHWRLGDYDDKYHTRLPLSYYLKAIQEIPSVDKAIIFSDDPDRAMQMGVQLHEHTGMEVEVSLGADYLQDFKLMKNCKHFITGNSSYSLMAAILGRDPKKKIVCPYQWFGPAWTPATKDLYPEGAIVI